VNISTLSNELFERGIKVRLEGERLSLSPSGAVTDDLRDTIRSCKPDIIGYLTRLSPGRGLPLYLNPPGCRNPFTPHSVHKFSWECDPDSCYCYKMFGYPLLCQSEPCRWVWLDGVPNKE